MSHKLIYASKDHDRMLLVEPDPQQRVCLGDIVVIDGIDINGHNFQQRAEIEALSNSTGSIVIVLNQTITPHASLSAAIDIYPGEPKNNVSPPQHVEFIVRKEPLGVAIFQYIEYAQEEKYACLDFEKNQFIKYCAGYPVINGGEG